jgi:hypothetical protein
VANLEAIPVGPSEMLPPKLADSDSSRKNSVNTRVRLTHPALTL